MKKPSILKLSLLLTPLVGLLIGVFYYTNNHLKITPYNIVPIVKKVPNNGIYTMEYANGNTKSKTQYHMGMKDGKEVLYYQDGIKKQINHYKHNVLNGFSYDYTKTGSLYSVTLYVDGLAQKSHIVNDSVYRNEITIGKYGEDLFTTSCATCHKKKVSSISQIPDSLSTIDTLSTKLIFNIDTVHYYLLDSMTFEHYQKRDTAIILEQYDLKALKFFLNQELQKKKKIKVIRSLNPRSKPL